jgi:CHAT domain-containing protein
MATSAKAPITFVVSGQRVGGTRGGAAHGAAPVPTFGTRGHVKDFVRLGAQRSSGAQLRVTATPGEDVVVLHISNGPTLTLHPEVAQELMLAQAGEERSRSENETKFADGEVEIPARLQWQGADKRGSARGATRGWLGDVLISAIEVVGGLFSGGVAGAASKATVGLVDGQVDPGLYRVRPEAMAPLKGSGLKIKKSSEVDASGTVLVLIHGTFSDTAGTFGKLWKEHPQRVRELFDHYGDRVYALDHATLGESPIANALMLAEALPAKTTLHLVTHSRGGLVAEVLARACALESVSAVELALFSGDAKAEKPERDAYVAQRNALKDLVALVKKKGLKVERMVRVACPARGTLLAGKRLDAYISVLTWAMKLASIPVAPALLEFLGTVAATRTDPSKLPGVAAMMPDSPLVRWLHAGEDSIPGDLRVIAGDIEGDSITSWIKTLLSDSFYWTDNDLVVQTRSMYGGVPRANSASFLLHAGGKVSHFNYFSNDETAQAICAALTSDQPHGFRKIGPLSWAGDDASGFRAAAPAGRAASELPAVFVLPGILGSHLKIGKSRIWLSWRIVAGLNRLKYQPGKADDVLPDGPIGSFYEDLIGALSEKNEVLPFAYDWRRPLEEEAQRLGKAIDAALKARDRSGQPVRVLAHSMGGLLARTMQLECPQTWDNMMGRPGARMLMLGTPNGGSWAPMQVLSGDDTFGSTLAAVGAPFQSDKARQLMADLPGFIQLQAHVSDALAMRETWQKLADDDIEFLKARARWHSSPLQREAARWGIPSKAALERAVKLRKALDAQRDNALPRFADRMLLVVGNAERTPDGYELGDDGMVYLDAERGGDGKVTLESAQLPGVRTWTVDCDHGTLPSHASAFDAYIELLDKGNTERLERLKHPISTTRGGEARGRAVVHLRSRPARASAGTVAPPQSMQSVLAQSDAPPSADAVVRGGTLRITLQNGNLKFVPQPLLIGHYRSLKLTGAEAVADRLMQGVLSRALRVDNYPNEPGSWAVFANRQVNPEDATRLPRPEGVIVVGLGEEGELNATALSMTIRKGVLGWALRMSEDQAAVPARFEIAAALVGSGGVGITAGASARAIARGVREANERLREQRLPEVDHLILIELYRDRATEAWQALQVEASAAPRSFTITPEVQEGVEALPRPVDAAYRGANYDFITATWPQGKDGGIMYTLDTRRARTEVVAQATQVSLVSELVSTASDHQNRDTTIGTTLFQLLVPVEMEAFFSGMSHTIIELDKRTAGIPWELLDIPGEKRAGVEQPPWAIRSKILRKLRTETYRQQVNDTNSDDAVLVIGEPVCDEKLYPRLPGALKEAQEVKAKLCGPSGIDASRVVALENADARSIVSSLLSGRYRIVHIAGHGMPAANGDPAGVVLSGNTFLGPREIKAMRTVPQLVFVNCCYLAARDPSTVLRADSAENKYDRASFAASVADQLIENGVRCVIAAGWAVEDGPAHTFATTFYGQLIAGRTFIDAVTAAREAARAEGGNTWAAYQCYGDPDWTYDSAEAATTRTQWIPEQFAGIATADAVILALTTVRTMSKSDGSSNQERVARIRYIEERFAAVWGHRGSVAEAFGAAYAQTDRWDDAIAWYARATTSNDGSASLAASEQLNNLRARHAFDGVRRARREGSTAEVEAAIRKGRTTIHRAIKELEVLARLHPTVERHNLCGSAYKRLAMLESEAKRTEASIAALRGMARHYAEAEQMSRRTGLNRLAAELLTALSKSKNGAVALTDVDAVQKSLDDHAAASPDCWSILGKTELRTYEALAAGKLAASLPEIARGYTDLRARVSDPTMWRTARDQVAFLVGGVKDARQLAALKQLHALVAKLADG